MRSSYFPSWGTPEMPRPPLDFYNSDHHTGLYIDRMVGRLEDTFWLLLLVRITKAFAVGSSQINLACEAPEVIPLLFRHPQSLLIEKGCLVTKSKLIGARQNKNTVAGVKWTTVR
jgi:hypothetical protein